MAKHVKISYAGVDISAVPDELRAQMPQLRCNYFDIPWTASCPGSGKVLVTHTQLNAIEAKLLENGENCDSLVLEVYDENENLISEESVTLLNIYAVSATPIWGASRRTGGIDADGSLSAGAEHDETTNTEGLWLLELQDERSLMLMRLMASPEVFNLENPPFDGTAFDATTAKTDSTGWNLDELISQAGIQVGGTFSPLPASGDDVLRNLYAVGIPALLFVDLLLHAHRFEMVCRYNPIDTTFGFSAIENPILDIVRSTFPKRIHGGFTYLYKQATATAKYRSYVRKANPTGGVRDLWTMTDVAAYYANQGEHASSIVPAMTHNQGATTIGISDRRSAGRPYHAVYRGFLGEWLDPQYPVSLVSFSWSNGYPQTEVHVGVQTPIRTLQESTHWICKDIPLRLSLDGHLGPPWTALGTGSCFPAVITQHCHTSKKCKFKASTGNGSTTPKDGAVDQIAWNGDWCWHETNDAVFVLGVSSPNDNDPKFIIVDKIPGLGRYDTTGGTFAPANKQDNPTLRSPGDCEGLSP